MTLTKQQIVEVIGYGVGGVVAVAAGEYVTAAKAFVLAATSLVDLDEAKTYLTPSAVERQQLIADVAEVVKFGSLS